MITNGGHGEESVELKLPRADSSNYWLLIKRINSINSEKKSYWSVLNEDYSLPVST